MSERKRNKALSDNEKQAKPMPGEVDPKYAKVEVFLAMQKVKGKLRAK